MTWTATRLPQFDSRKKAFSVTTGVFTRQQIHTVTFVRQEDAAAEPVAEGAPAMPTPPALGVSVADELAKLVALRDSGVLSDDEFAAQKTRLLGS